MERENKDLPVTCGSTCCVFVLLTFRLCPGLMVTSVGISVSRMTSAFSVPIYSPFVTAKPCHCPRTWQDCQLPHMTPVCLSCHTGVCLLVMASVSPLKRRPICMVIGLYMAASASLQPCLFVRSNIGLLKRDLFSFNEVRFMLSNICLY